MGLGWLPAVNISLTSGKAAWAGIFEIEAAILQLDLTLLRWSAGLAIRCDFWRKAAMRSRGGRNVR